MNTTPTASSDLRRVIFDEVAFTASPLSHIPSIGNNATMRYDPDFDEIRPVVLGRREIDRKAAKIRMLHAIERNQYLLAGWLAVNAP